MQKILGILKGSPYSSSDNVLPQSDGSQDLHSSENEPSDLSLESKMTERTSILESLPSELIDHILGFCSPASLAAVLQTSRLLLSHASNELFWMSFVKRNLPPEKYFPTALPTKSWRELYSAHHPYWFLPRHKIWFSDAAPSGALVIARYDHTLGCIEAYRLLARHRNPYVVQIWKHDPSVHVHMFDPDVDLMLDDPVVRLDLNSLAGNQSRLSGEVEMKTGRTRGISAFISLCRPMLRERQDPSMALWPPNNIPATERVRNESQNKFRGSGNRPQTLTQASDQAFRVRKYMQWSGMLQPLTTGRMGEEVFTFSTLPRECYTQTKQKPYQGIWVGDYSAHGCEFLLVMQGDRKNSPASRRSSTSSGLPSGVTFDERIESKPDETSKQDAAIDSNDSEPRKFAAIEANADVKPSGRIEAIKLTGDINIPRGQCTWFADEIGDAGLIRVAGEEPFKGARVVKSMGQVAGEGFKDHRFIDSELILVSHDTIAQYWKANQRQWRQRFSPGHISFYKRIDIDQYDWHYTADQVEKRNEGEE